MKADNIPSWRRGSEHKVLSLTKELSVTDPCWERGNQKMSPVEYPWVCQSHSKAGPGVVGQHKTPHDFWCVFCFVLVIFFVLLFVLIEREREREYEVVERKEKEL